MLANPCIVFLAAVVFTVASAPARGQCVFREAAKLTADAAVPGDHQFGGSVAVDGDTVVVGARLEDDEGSNSGSAYVFRNVDGIWQQIAKLTASDAGAEQWFGNSVAVSGDTAVIGAWFDDERGAAAGAAYVFRAVGGVWQQIAKLTAADATAGDLFGASVSVDGDTVVVGALLEDDEGSNSGSAYVFREVGGAWQQIAKLTAADAEAGDHFGNSVSVSGDTAVIGTQYDDDSGPESGSAYVFREMAGVWQQVAKLTASDAAAGDQFGGSVAVSGDTAVIGARYDDDGGPDIGSAYVFREVGGVWQQIAKLTAGDAVPGDHEFGESVAVGGDAAVVGAPEFNDGGADSGAAYFFREMGGVWQQVAKLTASDAVAGDFLGNSVSVGGDTAIVGARYDDTGGTDSGSVYAFRLADGNRNGVPDDCDPLSTPGPPHDRRKNRFISFAPNTSEAVAIRIELLDLECNVTGRKCSYDSDCRRCVGGAANGDGCSINADCPGGGSCQVSGESCVGPIMPVEPIVLGWVGDAILDPGESPPDTVTAQVVFSMPAVRVWTESPVHVGDCQIAPVQTYALSATTDGSVFSDPLILATIDKPQGKFWADIVGSFDGVAWSAPNYLVNVDDVVAWIKYVTLKPAPHVTVVDLDGETPNFIINATDLQFILAGFRGETYPPPSFSNQGTPADCP